MITKDEIHRLLEYSTLYSAFEEAYRKGHEKGVEESEDTEKIEELEARVEELEGELEDLKSTVRIAVYELEMSI